MTSYFLEDTRSFSHDNGSQNIIAQSYTEYDFSPNSNVVTNSAGYLSTSSTLETDTLSVSTANVGTANITNKVDLGAGATISSGVDVLLDATTLGSNVVNSSLINTNSANFTIGNVSLGEAKLFLKNINSTYEILRVFTFSGDGIQRLIIGSDDVTYIVLWVVGTNLSRTRFMDGEYQHLDSVLRVTKLNSPIDPLITMDSPTASCEVANLVGTKLSLGPIDPSITSLVLRLAGNDYIDISSGVVDIKNDLTISTTTTITDLLMTNTSVSDEKVLSLNLSNLDIGTGPNILATTISSSGLTKIDLQPSISIFGNTALETQINTVGNLTFVTNGSQLSLRHDPNDDIARSFLTVSSGNIALGGNQTALELYVSNNPVITALPNELYIDAGTVYMPVTNRYDPSAVLKFGNDDILKVVSGETFVKAPFNGGANKLSGHCLNSTIFKDGVLNANDVIDRLISFPVSGQLLYVTIKLHASSVGTTSIEVDLFNSSDVLQSNVITLNIPNTASYVNSSDISGIGSFSTDWYLRFKLSAGSVSVTDGLTICVYYRMD